MIRYFDLKIIILIKIRNKYKYINNWGLILFWMLLKRFQFYLSGVTLVACVLAISNLATAHTNNFPNAPIKVVVTDSTGGSSDLITRIVGQQLSDIWSQPVVLENRLGIAEAIGMQHAANQLKDGSVLTIGNLGPAGVNLMMTRKGWQV